MRLRVCAVLFAALAIASNARAANIQQLIQDTQRVSQDGGHLTLVWWIPQAYWQMSVNANTALSPEGRAQTLKALEDYTVFVLVRATPGVGGIAEASSLDDMLLNSTLEVGGETVRPISGDAISPQATNILATLKPVLSHLLGQLGQIMQVVVYPAKKDGKLIIDPTASGGFTYTLFDQTFRWHLPLGSLLPPRFDPKTKEQFPGNYEFNPYTGAKLSTTL